MALTPLRFTVGPSTGAAGVAEVVDFSDLSMSFNLDDGCQMTLNAAGNSPATKVVNELATDVWVYLGATLLQRFRVLTVEQSWGVDGEDTISLTAICYRRLLGRRLLNNDLSFSAVGQADIAWALVQDTQAATNGDLGITEGTLDSGGITRSRSDYLRGSNIGELLTNLSNVINGPRINISPTLAFSAVPAGPTNVLPQPVARGVTARSLTRSSGAADFANVVLGFGDEEATTPKLAEDFSAGAAFGRWESTAAWNSVTVQATLDESTDSELQERVSPLATWAVEIDPARWRTDMPVMPNDEVTVVVPRSTVAPVVAARTVQALCVDLQLGFTADAGFTVAASLVEVA